LHSTCPCRGTITPVRPALTAGAPAVYNPGVPIDPRLLELLACPVCHAAVDPRGDDGLACRGCGRVYPIRDGIPVMLAEELPPAGGSGGSA